MGNYEDENKNENLGNNTNKTYNNNINSNNRNSSYKMDNKKENLNLNSSFNGLCGNISNQEVIYNKKKTEIDLTTTYSSAKGTYTNESYRLFSEKEKNFFYLIQRNNISGIRYLIIQGVNINILDEERTSPLHIACKESSIQTIEEIIFQGSMINIPDLVGWTPLHMACYYNRPDVVLLLLKSGANYNTHNRDKLSARDLAIKFGNYNCVKVLDNFIKYQQIEKEKCLKEINNDNFINNEDDYYNFLNDEIYEEILKKYITYQKLKREYMQNNEAILSSNDLNTFKDEENESNNDMVNDELYPTAQIQKICTEKIALNQIEKCLNILSIQMSQRKEKNKREEDKISPDKLEIKKRNNLLLSKYKFIPKRHKFYLKFMYKDGKFIIKNNKNENKNKEYFIANNSKIINNDINLINIPSSMPKMPSMRNLNNIKTYTKNNNEKNEDSIKIEEESEIYRPYNYGDDEDSDNLDGDEINLDIPLNELDGNNSNLLLNKNSDEISDDDDKTISLDEENINFHYDNILENNYKDQKILLKPFNIDKNPDKNIVQYFLAHNDIYEEILQILFHFDYFFGLQFLMTISNIDNSIISLINYVSTNIYNSRLRLEILNLMNYKNKSTILESFFNLFNTKNDSIFQNIKKILKLFDLTINDIKLIDQISYSFSKIYFGYNSKLELFNSQNAVYFFVFSFIITQITYNQNISKNLDKKKIICDMVIMLKDLNEGKNYDDKLIKEAVCEIKNNNELIVVPFILNNYEQNLFNVQFRRNKDNILSSFSAYFYNGIFIILNKKKEIEQIINLQLDPNISCTIIQHSSKICFTSLQNKIVIIINLGYNIKFQKSLFFEMYVENNHIMNKINKYFQNKRGFKKSNNF